MQKPLQVCARVSTRRVRNLLRTIWGEGLVRNELRTLWGEGLVRNELRTLRGGFWCVTGQVPDGVGTAVTTHRNGPPALGALKG